MLLRDLEAMGDRSEEQYSPIILDEAHERSLATNTVFSKASQKSIQS